MVKKFFGVKLFIIFLYCPFNGCRICSDTPCFILDTGDLYFLSFYRVSLSRGLCILSILFSKNQFLLHWFFSLSYDFYSLSFLFFCLFWVYFMLFLVFWGRNLGYWLDFLFSNVSTSCCIFPSHPTVPASHKFLYIFIFSSMYWVMFESGTQTCPAETKTAIYQKSCSSPQQHRGVARKQLSSQDCFQVVFAFG